jgi:ADP-heptose:LPS heptosyltransferase
VKSAVLARSTCAPEIVGFESGHAREGPAAWCYTERVDPDPAVHVVDRNLALATRAGATAIVRRFPLRVPEMSANLASSLRGVPSGFVVMNPGAGWPNKRWPVDRFSSLAKRVQQEHRLKIVVLWGPGERALAGAVANADDGVIIAPETSLADLVAVLSRAALFIGGDTGPLHVAAALGTPVVGIYGPTDPARNGPWSPIDVSLSRRARCECFHARRCHASRWCLDDISVDEVERAVSQRLASAGHSRSSS